jgi:hypothetical protein
MISRKKPPSFAYVARKRGKRIDKGQEALGSIGDTQSGWSREADADARPRAADVVCFELVSSTTAE